MRIRMNQGPVNVPASGAVLMYYRHDPRHSPTKIELMTAEITSGTQTGVVVFYLLGEGDRHIQLSTHELTADDHQATIFPRVTVGPGEGAKIYWYGVTAGDEVQGSIWGY